MEEFPILDYRSLTQTGAINTMHKQILVPARVRRLPRADWSWIDRRFIREYSAKLGGDAVFLYLFLAAVGDKHGLSFYSDNALALRLRTTERTIVTAREELLEFDLVAYRAPLVQVLSLPSLATERSGKVQLRSLWEQLGQELSESRSGENLATGSQPEDMGELPRSARRGGSWQYAHARCTDTTVRRASGRAP